MKRISVFFGVLLFLAASVLSTFCFGKDKIIETHNKYGGKTEEEIYQKGDKQFENGISKIVEYYDSKDRIVKIVSYYRDISINKDGVFRREQYYNNEPFEMGKLTKAEFYYSKEHSRQNGLVKSEVSYDNEEKKTKTEFYYSPEYAEKKILSKMEVFYDKEGEATKRIYYDLTGTVISIEEKQLEWKTKK